MLNNILYNILLEKGKRPYKGELRYVGEYVGAHRLNERR
jgi:hypothetical protein